MPSKNYFSKIYLFDIVKVSSYDVSVMKSIKDAFLKVLTTNVVRFNDNISSDFANDLETKTVNELLAELTVRKVLEAPSTKDVVNLSKITGEFTENANILMSPIDRALSDCKIDDK